MSVRKKKKSKKKAIPIDGFDPPTAVINYKKLLNISYPLLIQNPKSYRLGTMHISGTWSRGPHFEFSRVSIPFPLQLRRDRQEVLRIKVLGYSTRQFGQRQPSTTVENNLVSWRSLSILNLGVGKFKQITWLLVPPSVAPTLSPTLSPSVAPSVAPTKSPTTKSPTTKSPTTKSPTTKRPFPPFSGWDYCERKNCKFLVVPNVTTDIPVVSSANFLVVGVASVMPFFLTFF